ncbi:MAG: ATP-dependent helicase HrpB [Deltaproteobacteria bacterium]|nr:ATP-dependent helicase HrpB [Deltaproteobacteria bacterium]
MDDVLEASIEALREHASLVVVAPPGAGKSTRLPPALLDACSGKVLMLQPRRVAARAVAARIAEERGVPLGQEVGYRVRLEKRVSDATRLEVLTEGILTRRLQHDPFLDGVSAVVLDEFHERSIHLDLALALLKEVQAEARPDLWIVVMSATLDARPVAAYLGAAPVQNLKGRAHPIEIVHVEREDTRRLAERVLSGVRRVLASARHDVLVFLPGAAEIRRTAQALEESDVNVDVIPLFGAMPLKEQRRVLVPPPPPRQRRVVLATNVAETSLTIEGVDAVVDSGLVKLARHDPGAGIDRLELTPVSQASAAQRAGRAGRVGPGHALRLHTLARHASLPQHTPPEIRRVDLAPMVLELRAWGAEPHTFDFFEPPPKGALHAADLLLERLGALDKKLHITPLGRRLTTLPLHPRLGATLIAAVDARQARAGSTIVALLSERDPLDRAEAACVSGHSDLLERLERLDEAEERRFDGKICRRLGLNRSAALRVVKVRDELLTRLGVRPSGGDHRWSAEVLLRALLAGFGDRVARQRDPGSDRALMVGGRGLRLAAESVVRDTKLFIAHQIEGGKTEGRVTSASAIERGWLRLEAHEVMRFDVGSERVIATSETRYLDLVLDQKAASPDPDEAATLLQEAATADPFSALRPGPAARRLLARLTFLQAEMPELGITGDSRARLLALLPALCTGKTSFAQLRTQELATWIEGTLPRALLQALRREAPERTVVPSGREIRIDYPEDGSTPVLAVKLQELFGLADTPRIAAGRVPLLLHLLAPNGRATQVTRDLRSFWNTTYAEVRKDLRRRYPKHPWPEDPWSAVATHRTKRR